MKETKARIDWPTVMLVAFDEAEANVFSRVLDAQMFKVIRVPSVAAAKEQILGAMPHVVAVSGSAPGLGDSAFSEMTTAIGAEVMVVAPDAEPKAIDSLLCRAVDRALARRAGLTG